MKRVKKQFLAATFYSLSAGLLFATCTKDKKNTPIYPENCGNYLVGDYLGSDYCSSSGQSPYPCSISANTPTNINFSNLYGVTVVGILNCADNSISIPNQSFAGNFSISGSGTFTANRIIITWSGVSYGIPINCSSTFTR